VVRFLVTGSNGFIGRHVVAALIGRGHKVRCMIQPGTSSACFDGVCEDVMEADLVSPDSLLPAVDGCDAVVHLAALVQEWGRWEWFERVNVRGTMNLAEAAVAAGTGRFLFMSSLAVHGTGSFQDAGEDSPLDHAGNPYARSKIEAERMLQKLHRQGELEAVIVRPGMVPYGEWDVRGFSPLAATLKRGMMPITGSANHLTCTVYAPNLADGIALALERDGASGQVYIMTDGAKLSWADYFSAIAHTLGSPLRIIGIPNPAVRIAAAAAEALWRLAGPGTRPPITTYLARLMTRDTHFSSHKAVEELGYQPKFSFSDGITRTCRWWLLQGQR